MKKKILSLSACALSLTVSFILFRLGISANILRGALDAAWIAVVLGGAPVLAGAVNAIRNRKIDAALLLSVALIVCVGLGIYSSIIENFEKNYYFIAGGIALFGAESLYLIPKEGIKDNGEKLIGKLTVIVLLAAVLVFSVTSAVIGLAEGFSRMAAILCVYSPSTILAAYALPLRAAVRASEEDGFEFNDETEILKFSGINTVCFDKSGTLTDGVVKIDKITTKSIKEKELIRLAAALESFSDHPVGKAVRSLFSDEPPKAYDVQNVKGVGITGKVEEREVKILKWTVTEREFPEEKEWMEKNNNKTKTLLAVIIDGRLEGAIAVGDTVREGAKEAVDELNGEGYRTVLMTGDSSYSAKSVAKQLDIKERKAELLPEDKGELILELQKEGAVLLAVGDGINDAEAFLQADAAIAFGKGKAENAVLLKGEPKSIPKLLARAKRLKFLKRLNIIEAAVLIAVGAVLSALGLITAFLGSFIQLFGILLMYINEKNVK